MGSKMLVDAAHPEETRVVVVRNKRVEDFDYESATRKQLRGNIYLAKVTRVEPSLQAAFVDYGGNRHGFLAFSEIHPDYYQIPVADRQALIEEEAQEHTEAEAAEAAQDESSPVEAPEPSPDNGNGSASEGSIEEIREEIIPEEVGGIEGEPKRALQASNLQESISEAPAAQADDRASATDSDAAPTSASASEEPANAEVQSVDANVSGNGGAESEPRQTREKRGHRRGRQGEENGRENVESVGSEDALEEVPERVRRRKRVYKIQEVIKRRQIILVQVVKEERGNKGAALTTYLSLAGRHTVLMPNTARGGGISRKITNPADRKRLRKIAGELEVPEGMGLIIRTAGASRTKSEVKRDYEYLLRLWENVRDLTLKSSAPTLVYEEGNLIKRSIRDLYGKEIDEILVAGEEAYKEAKDFMRMLLPSHAKNVKVYREPEPIFVRHQIERQLSAMFSPYVTLRSGGYIVINQTEALVSIDVNSGKATREHNIEDTALKTNLEAAEEIARQLRLRDLAGLIVIDFIDMDERRNNRSVERRLKECLRTERARIQVGRISHFGLLEMSRQRLRAGVLAGTTTGCPMCMGSGVVRSTESVALDCLRSMEDLLMSEGVSHLTTTTPVDVALYILNQKRAHLKDIEARYGIGITVNADESLHGGNFRIEKTAGVVRPVSRSTVVQMDWAHAAGDEAEAEVEEEAETETETETEDTEESPATSIDDGEQQQGGRRRRRRRRGRRGEPRGEHREAPAQEAAAEAGSGEEPEERAEGGPERGPREEGQRRPRRRGRRGGRRARAARQANGGSNGGNGGHNNGHTSQDYGQQDHQSESGSANPPYVAQESWGGEATQSDPSHQERESGETEREAQSGDSHRQTWEPSDRVEPEAQTREPEPPSRAEEELSGPPRRGWWQKRS